VIARFKVHTKEKGSMIKFLSVAVLTVASLAAEAVPVCLAVTEDDARSLIGSSAKRTKDPSACGWVNGQKQLNVARVGTPAPFESFRAHSAQEGKTQTESGLGGAAFSSIPSADHGSRAAIYLVKGPAILVIDIDGFEPGRAEEHLPQVRDLVRKLVPKL
jgi:hypothetical protein